jgi:hypothetical protein
MMSGQPQTAWTKRLELLERDDPRLYRIGQLAEWLWSERHVARETSVPIIHAWLGAIRRDVLADVRESEDRIDSQEEEETGSISLRDRIREGRAVLKLALPALVPAGWMGAGLEEDLGRDRDNADVLAEISLRTEYTSDQVKPLLSAIGGKLNELERGSCFEPLGCIAEVGGDELKIGLWNDYLQPRMPGRATRYDREEIQEIVIKGRKTSGAIPASPFVADAEGS